MEKIGMGVWVDHEKAFIVAAAGERKKMRRLESNVEGRVRLSGGSRSRSPYGPQDIASESKREERRKHQLRRYYQNIIRELGDAHEVLIFGPGEAKIELEKEMRRSKSFAAEIAAIEPADKMTEKQIIAVVRNFFRSKI